jgi:hypothetical protein
MNPIYVFSLHFDKIPFNGRLPSAHKKTPSDIIPCRMNPIYVFSLRFDKIPFNGRLPSGGNPARYLVTASVHVRGCRLLLLPSAGLYQQFRNTDVTENRVPQTGI